MKNVSKKSRAGAHGKTIVCPNCLTPQTVYHFAWVAITCNGCNQLINKEQWVIDEFYQIYAKGIRDNILHCLSESIVLKTILKKDPNPRIVKHLVEYLGHVPDMEFVSDFSQLLHDMSKWSHVPDYLRKTTGFFIEALYLAMEHEHPKEVRREKLNEIIKNSITNN